MTVIKKYQGGCVTHICHISYDMRADTISLLRKIASTNTLACQSLYTDLNQCQNPNRTDSLGHPLNCQLDCNCSSLLRPDKLLSCHFGLLRIIVRNIYKLQRIALALRAVNNATDSGCFMTLKAAVKYLLKVCSPSLTANDSAASK